MLVERLLDSHFYNNATQKHSLVIAGVDDVPVEIDRGVRIDQHDLCSSHEEADIHITQHAIALRLLGKSVNVVFDNKDVFVLLVHFYNSQFKASNPPPPPPMFMSSPVKERAVVDIPATAEAHLDIAPDLLAIHGLSGADNTASLHDIGKGTVLEISKKGGILLFNIGDVAPDIKSGEAQATAFICAHMASQHSNCTSMTECRVKLWRFKTGRSGASSVKLCSLPPTIAAFIQNFI